MQNGPARGLPARIVVPIVALAALAFLGLIAYFLHVATGSNGAVFGPSQQQGDAEIRATAAPRTPPQLPSP
ncbi:MAG: hypothetical protein ACREM2_09320 [Vulcanimicrobiaceae bacterium]